MIEAVQLGELVLTQDEHVSITSLIPTYPNGMLPPGYVTLVVDASDRLARFRDGVSRVLYEAPHGLETLCIAAVHTCPVLPQRDGEHTTSSRYCFRGQTDEWWIIMPGAHMMFIKPKQPLRVYKDVVIVFEVIPTSHRSVPQLLIPYTSDQMNVSIHGAV